MRTFKVVMSKGEQGYIVVECPELPGCISQGKTTEEARVNIQDAIKLYLATLRKHNEHIPSVKMIDVQVLV